MIATSLRIDGFDGDEWRRLARLFRPGEGRSPPPLLLLVEGPRLVAALRPASEPAPHRAPTHAPPGHSPAPAAGPGAAGPSARPALPSAGPQLLDVASLDWQGPASLPRLRAQVGARVAAALDVQALDRLARAIDAAVDPRQDLVEQTLAAVRALRAEAGRGLFVDPDLFARIPVPGYPALQQTFDALLPDDRAAALFVFDERRGALHASLVLEKRGGHLVRLTSHHALGPGAAPADFRGGRHQQLLGAVERNIAQPHLALFCTRAAWREIVGPASGALARQVALREAVIDPIPPWLLAMTSIGAAASMAQGASRLLGRFVPPSGGRARGVMGSLTDRLVDRMKEEVKDRARALTEAPFAALGFDPIQLYQELLKLL